MLKLGQELGQQVGTMSRGLNRLSARFVATVTEAGRYADGGNLYFSISPNGGRRWVFLYRTHGKLKEMGLGSARDISLAKARDRSQAARALLVDGLDPLQNKRAEIVATPTFGEVANGYVDDMAPGWSNPKHIEQWRTTLGNTEADASKLRIDVASEKQHREALAALRALPVDKVETDHVLSVLSPIWQEKPETASRLRGRIEAVLAAASAKGLRSGFNPAQWRNHLDRLLPRRRKLSRGHHAALPYADVPEFMTALRQRQAVAALAVEFTILTAARSGETLGAQWKEIDLNAAVWTVPAGRMKAKREHRVPLSDSALAVLNVAAKLRPKDDQGESFVFPGQRKGRPLSNMSMAMLLHDRMKLTGITVHGFRSSFRDWAGECTSVPREIAEAALAHVVGDETERAYRRGDALEKRRTLMDEWAAFCSKSEAGEENAADGSAS